MDLQKENEERIWQEGIFRQVPVVGTFVNWWSPKANASGGVKGRSLNLTQGVVESTENIYKYHMQLHGTSIGSKSPPTPLVQTPVGGGHSRSSSHASSQGGGPPPVKGESGEKVMQVVKEGNIVPIGKEGNKKVQKTTVTSEHEALRD